MVRCPFCSADDDRVVDSRLAEDGVAIRRRRECANCSQRYTTFERIEEVGFFVVKLRLRIVVEQLVNRAVFQDTLFRLQKHGRDYAGTGLDRIRIRHSVGTDLVEDGLQCVHIDG